MTHRSGVVLVATAMIGLGWALAGCDSANKVNVSPPKEEEQHAHVHHGPRGGHLMEIGEEEFHAEWTDDESGKVTFYFLDGEAKKEVAVEGEEITIEVRIGDKEPVLYKLAAIEPKEGKATAYELVDKNLQGVLDQLGRGVSATFPKLTIAGKAFENLKIEEHKHEEHKHEEEQKK